MTHLPEDFWETRFQHNETPWERPGINPAFAGWRQSGALSPCRILVPGAGRSPEPGALRDAGFDVTSLDLSASAAAHQAARIGPEHSVRADATTWLPPRPFDAVYDQTCLCALPPPLWPAYEAQLRRWLPPGGRLFILFMQSPKEGGPPFHCAIPEMQRLFATWCWPETLGEPVPHGFGAEIPAILARA